MRETAALGKRKAELTAAPYFASVIVPRRGSVLVLQKNTITFYTAIPA